MVLMFYISSHIIITALFFIVMNLSLAAVIFPVGFDSPEIGGMSFQLPTNTSLGSSYVSFIFSIAFTFLGEVCMRKGHSTVHAL